MLTTDHMGKCTDPSTLPTSLSKITYMRAYHVVTENQRCIDGAVALENGDFVIFGKLMVESHNSLRSVSYVSPGGTLP